MRTYDHTIYAVNSKAAMLLPTGFGLGEIIAIGGHLLRGRQNSRQAAFDAETARIRAEWEPQLIMNQAAFQSHILKRQADVSLFNARAAEGRRTLFKNIARNQITRIQGAADRQISRRNLLTARRIARNNDITEERRSLLVRRLGYSIQDLGESAAELFAGNETARSASGFSMRSVSYQRRRLVNRNKLRDRLSRLNEEYTGADQLLLDENYNNNMSILEQTYLANEGAREEVFARVSDIREQAHIRDLDLRDSAFRSRYSAMVDRERSNFILFDAEQRAEFTKILAERGAHSAQSQSNNALLGTAFDIGSEIVNYLNP